MQPWTKRVILVGLVATLVPILKTKAPAIKCLVQNLPDKLPIYSAYPHKILFADQVRNCEDFILDEDLGIAYLSCDPGRDRWNTVLGLLEDPYWKAGSLQYYNYAQHSYDSPGQVHKLEITDWTESARKQFHPLGIGRKAGSRTIFVVNHAPDGPSVEQFKLSKDGKSAKHVRTIKHDPLHAPNSVAPLSETELLVTNDHYFTAEKSWVLNKIETYLGPPLASVVHVDLKTGNAEIVARLPYANGIIPLNGTHLAVSSTTTPAVYIYAMDINSKSLTLQKKIIAPFFTDNLKLDSAGTLLVAGHPHPGPVDKVAAGQRRYNVDNDPMATELLPEKDRPRSGSWVAEWDGNEEGTLKNLIISNEFDTACAALRDIKRGVGFVSGLYGKGIMMWQE